MRPPSLVIFDRLLLLLPCVAAGSLGSSGAAAEVVAVEQHSEQGGSGRQDHGCVLVREVARSFHGTQEGVELRRLAERLRVDARRLALALASPPLGPLGRTAEDPRLLLLPYRAYLQPLLLPFRAVLHTDAAAFGFHSGVEPEPVLFGKVEVAQLDVDDIYTIVCDRDVAAPLEKLGDNRFGPIGGSIGRDECGERIASDGGSQFGK